MSEEQGTKTAKILYRPWGLISSLLGGIVARKVFETAWKKLSPTDTDDPPKPLQSEYGVRQIVLAALLQGAIFAAVRAVIDRGGARLFQRWTGEWPGD